MGNRKQGMFKFSLDAVYYHVRNENPALLRVPKRAVVISKLTFFFNNIAL